MIHIPLSPWLQVVFPVSGSKGTGMVCAEATVARGKMQLRAVTFDATGKVGTPGGAASLQGPLLVTGSRHRIGVRAVGGCGCVLGRLYPLGGCVCMCCGVVRWVCAGRTFLWSGCSTQPTPFVFAMLVGRFEMR